MYVTLWYPAMWDGQRFGGIQTSTYRTTFDIKSSIFGFAHFAMVERAEGPQKSPKGPGNFEGLPSPPQELEGGARSALNFKSVYMLNGLV